MTDGSPTSEKLLAGTDDLSLLAAGLPDCQLGGVSRRLNADPESLEQGLAQLVLTLIDFLRQLMERQAVRRMESGSLTDDEIERLGRTFLRLADRMEELTQAFGLEPEDLNLHLGPLGDLL